MSPTPQELALRDYHESAYPERITEIVPGTIYHVMGYGHSNATFIIGDSSVILIDTLDSRGRGQRLRGLIRERTDKPIKTIIYTHGHPDHRGGAGALVDADPENIAFASAKPVIPRMDALRDILTLRGERQFGYHLTDDEVVTQGLGPREGLTHGDAYAFVPPTTVYAEPEVTREIDGVTLSLVAAPGETDDTLFVWLPDHEVLCCADNYYATFPNLYAIRGSQYRDVDTWIQSLTSIIDREATWLLPGHTAPIHGKDTIRERLTLYREALEHVLSETLRLMNDGWTADEIAATVELPAHLRDLPFLQQFYGTVEWSVRGIFAGYVGWFDGNPTSLHPLAPRKRAERMVNALGGRDAVLSRIKDAVTANDHQWAMELADHLLALDANDATARSLKAAALLAAAPHETSALGRHYYIACAQELAEES